MYRYIVSIVLCICLIICSCNIAFASSDVTFPSPQPVYIDQGGYTISNVDASGNITFSSTSFVGAITNLCQSIGKIISYYTKSDITVNQANNTPRITNFKGAIFDISMILSGIYADSSSIRQFINNSNITLGLIDNKLDSIYTDTSHISNMSNVINNNISNFRNKLYQYSVDSTTDEAWVKKIFDTLYYDTLITDYVYIDNYTDAVTSIYNYPYEFADNNTSAHQYFKSILRVDKIKDNILKVYYPVTSGSVTADGRYFYLSNNSDMSDCINVYNSGITVTSNIDNDVICLTFDFTNYQNIYNYKYFVCRNFTIKNISNHSVYGFTPYYYTEVESKKSYFELWRELYASDDIVNSKEQQKPLETQVLDDFTGDGNASVSLGDASSMAGISSDIKSGFSAGGSVDGLMNVFNSSDPTLFSWFTNQVSNEINNIYSPSRSLHNSSNGNDIINMIDKQMNDINNQFN